jgi:hypothetical protein
MRGATPPLPQHALMAWCLVKHRDDFTSRTVVWQIIGINYRSKTPPDNVTDISRDVLTKNITAKATTEFHTVARAGYCTKGMTNDCRQHK